MWIQRLGLSCLLLSGCVFRPDSSDDEHGHDVRGADSGSDGVAGASATHSRSQTSGPIEQGEFCDRWARAACSEAVVSACQASNADECRQSQAAHCRTLAPSEVASTGREECISAVASAFRDADLRGEELAVVLRFGGPCARTVVGTVAAGDRCEASKDCDVAHGYTCVRKADTGMGSCQKPELVEPGRDCEAAPKTCGEGFFCDGQNCIETLSKGEGCLIHEQCGSNGYCDGEGHCAERLAVNDSCKSDVQCARGVCAQLGDEQVCTDRVVLARADPLCETLR